MRRLRQQWDIVFVVGYGLYKAAGSSGYLTAFGMVGGSAGFVSVDGFMIASTLCAVLTCLLLGLLGLRLRERFPRRGVALGAYGLLMADFALAAVMGQPWLAGALHGMASTALSVVWFALCVQKTSRPAVAVVSALLLSVALQAVVAQGDWGGAPLSVGLLALSACCLLGLCGLGRGEGAEGSLGGMWPRSESGFWPALLCLVVCVFVVSASNVTVMGSSLEPLFVGMDMQTTNMVGALVAAVLVFCGSSIRHPVKAYTYVLPFLFAMFSLIAIFGEGIGAVAGSVMVGSYEAIAFLFAAFSVGLAFQEKLNPYAFSPVCFGASNVALLLGLMVGAALGMLGNRGLPLPVLVALVSLYPLGLVLLFVTRRHRTAPRRDWEGAAAGLACEEVDASVAGGAGAEGASDGGTGAEEATDEVELALRHRAAEIAAAYGLTHREEEILSYVARGRSARVIAKELFISESTAWSHIKKIYAKTNRRSKQALLDLFQGNSGS
ncbi:helix-turn-helix transcriptional regulator [Adlercreutzia muris]|uniref:helix-turn-helix transcriptional regulator n=1 Tax=Adlercreutzia muris TaxID=1796610 RepID=UPI003512049D